MNVMERRFWTVLPTFALVCWIYPALMWSFVGFSWVKVDAASNIFGALALPLAFALFAALYDPKPFQSASKTEKRVMYFSLALLVGLVLLSTWEDLGRQRPAVAHALSAAERDSAARFDKTIRDAVPKPRTTYDPDSKGDLNPAWKKIATGPQWNALACTTGTTKGKCDPSDESALACYRKCFPDFKGVNDFLSRAGLLGYVGFLHTIVATLFAITVLWYTASVAYILKGQTKTRAQRIFNSNQADRLLLVIALLCVFFPTRAMTEWYYSFYSFKYLQDYDGFFLLLAVAVVEVIAVALILKSGEFSQVVAIAGSIITAIVAIAFVRNPDSAVWFFDRAAHASMAFYLTFSLFFAVVLLWLAAMAAKK